MQEDAARTFTDADFGFTDPDDTLSSASAFLLRSRSPRSPGPEGGTLRLNGTAVNAGQEIPTADLASGKLTYTPAANANGAGYASFTFQVRDNGGTTNNGLDTDQTANTLSINVSPMNDAPVAAPDSYTTSEDDTLLVMLAGEGVLANDADADGDSMSATVLSDVAHGELSLAVGGTFAYTPDANFNGLDSFNYTVSDGKGGIDTETASITVSPVNDAPTASGHSLEVTKGTTHTITLVGDDLETPGDLTYDLIDGPAHGTLSDKAGDVVDYTPTPGYTGPDSFTFTVTDAGDGASPEATSAPATVSIDVTAVPTSTEVSDPTATYGDTEVALDATVSRQVGIASVDSGSVTFTVRDAADDVVGSPVEDDSLSDGAASVSYPLPAGTDAGEYTVDADYVGTTLGDSSGSSDLTVKGRGIEVTADSGSKTYGQADPALTYQVTEGSLAEGDDFSGALTRENGQGAGGYDILQGTLSAGPNYDLSYVGATFTIDPKALSGSFTAEDKTYDATTTATVKARSLPGVEDGDEVTLVVSNPRFADKNVGQDKDVTGELSLDGVQAGNYTVNASHITTADITERGIEVTADSGSKTYGQADPALTYQVTEGSLAEGDDFSGALTRENGQGAGGYDILQGTLSAGPNYDLSYVGATFTIDPKALSGSFTAEDKTYDATTTATVKARSLPGVEDGDEVTLVVSNPRFADKNVGQDKDVTGELSSTACRPATTPSTPATSPPPTSPNAASRSLRTRGRRPTVRLIRR